MEKSKIIINADDYSIDEGCSLAILKSFEMGIITDTTMMVNTHYFDSAVNALYKNGLTDKIGIHFNLTQGEPLTEKIKSQSGFVRDGLFHGNINRNKILTKEEMDSIYEELSAQTLKFINTGIPISHADSHHHIHNDIFILPIILKVCKENNIKKIRLLRNVGEISFAKLSLKKIVNGLIKTQGFKSTDYFGSASDFLFKKPETGTFEIMVHPGYDKEGNLIDIIKRTDMDFSGSLLVDALYDTIDYEMICYKQL